MMRRAGRWITATSALTTLATPALADQLWLGLYQHDVSISSTRFETGQDIKGGWTGKPITALSRIGKPSPHVLASISLNGGTNYLAAGVNWKFGRTLYLRPGIGIAVQDGPSYAVRKGRRSDLGSPVLFEPEIAAGWQVTEAIALEASWIHLSHATLFSRQNRGLDSWGLRALVKLR